MALSPKKSTTSGDEQTPVRVSRGALSREEIVEAALAAVKTTGFEQMTIRSLAADLGVGPMSLYRHIRDKDDLMDEVVDEILARRRPFPPREGPWQSRITTAADKLRRLLVSEPATLYVYLRHPVVTPAAVDRMEQMVEVLRTAGFDEPSAREAYGTIQVYTIGFAALAASRANWRPKDTDRHLATELAAMKTPRQFERNLRILLDGLANHFSQSR